MPANPRYDPGWAETAARLAAARDQLRVESAWLGAEAFGSPRHLQTLARLADLAAALKAAELSRNPTIAEYAAARFAALPAPRDGVDVMADPAGFTSVEEVDAAVARARARLDEAPILNAQSLRLGQPDGLEAFADPAAVVTSPRRFAPELLGRRADAAPLDCVVHYQALGADNHFCITHRWGELAVTSRAPNARAIAQRAAFQRVASQLARDAILFTLPHATPVFEPEGHRALANREAIREVNALAARLIFYRHALPARGQREEFGLVRMTWDGARFIEPDFGGSLYDRLPAALRI
ncbi:MAG: hypothetical protein B7Z80_09980 [Rhodospirillales bacterium 20-64-7]|nr:MAG: hypothetical protein B7Z80_09980 [Rhodospirillales bacterium 20-64-7]